MLNSETLEVAIGMAFLVLLMSLVCTAIKEWVEGLLKWRAMDLERGIRTLLDDADGTITRYVYQHPLVNSLFAGQYDPSHLRVSRTTPGQGVQEMRLSGRRHLPSYIPARNFARAVIDIVARGPVHGDDGDQLTARLSVDALRQRVLALQSAHLRRALLSAMDHAAGDLDRVQKNVEQWFDSTMDRASGWYKRRTQALLFVLGIGVAVVLNVDSLHVMNRLTTDKTFRDAVVRQAEAAKAPDSAASATPTEKLDDLRRQIRQVSLPMGWIGNTPRQLCTDFDADQHGQPCVLVGNLTHAWLRVVLGWFITSFAVMLGAPFWFDVLNRVMVIRSTVKPHEKSPEEASQDPGDRDVGGRGGTSAAPPPPAPSPPATAAAPDPAVQTAVAPQPSALPAAAAPSAFQPHEWRQGFSNPDEVAI
jgi:hypothetical protein